MLPEEPNPKTTDKGKEGGSCNRTACQKPNSAKYYNRSTRAFYCRTCALLIHRANPTLELFPNLIKKPQ